jgi:hypothetical protein
MSNDAIAFHLTETKASLTSTTLYWLARQDLQRSTSARVDLVIHHVLQTLVVRGTNENQRLELAAGEAIVHCLVTA